MRVFLFFILGWSVTVSAVLAETPTATDYGLMIAKGASVAVKITAKLQKALADMGIDGMEIVEYAKKHPWGLFVKVPEHSRRRLIVFSPGHEKIFAAQCCFSLWSNNKVYVNEYDKARAQRIAEKITAVLPPKLPVQIVLIKDDDVNACCLADGTLVINRGLLRTLLNDSDLASVLAHEYGHAISRHAAENLTKMLLQSAVEVCVTEAIKGTAYGSCIPDSIIGAAYGLCADLGFALPYSRVMEYEADRLGLIFLSKAGYDPERMIHLFKFFDKINPDSPSVFSRYLSTHPMNKERIEKAELFINPMKCKYYNINEAVMKIKKHFFNANGTQGACYNLLKEHFSCNGFSFYSFAEASDSHRQPVLGPWLFRNTCPSRFTLAIADQKMECVIFVTLRQKGNDLIVTIENSQICLLPWKRTGMVIIESPVCPPSPPFPICIVTSIYNWLADLCRNIWGIHQERDLAKAVLGMIYANLRLSEEVQ